MSREFNYRRDYDQYRPGRRDTHESLRATRDRDENRSDHQPTVLRRTTGDWVKGAEAVVSPGNASRKDEEQYPRTTPAAALHARPPSIAFDGATNDAPRTNTPPKSPPSLIHSVASVLISLSRETYLAGSAQQLEEAAQKRLAAAEKQDQQNRHARGWTTLIEQGEEEKKVAIKLLDDAKKRNRDASEALSVAAANAASRIVDLTATSDLDRIKKLESVVTTLTNDLANTRKELDETKLSKSQDLSRLENQVSETLQEYAGITSEVMTLSTSIKEVERDISEKVGTLQAEQNTLRIESDRLRATTAKCSESGQSLADDCGKLKTAVLRLNSALGNTVQHSDFVRLSAMVESLSKPLDLSSNTPPADLEGSTHQQDPELSSDKRTMMSEIVRVEEIIDAVNEARLKDHNLIAKDTASCIADVTALKSQLKRTSESVDDILIDRGEKERILSERFTRCETSLTELEERLQAELKKQVGSVNHSHPEFPVAVPQNAGTSATETHATILSRSSQPKSQQHPEPATLERDIISLKDEVRKLQLVLSKLLPDVRTAMDQNKANTHSIKSLNQRYNNLTTEDMTQAMIRQLEQTYPHASAIQGTFDILFKEIETLRGTWPKLDEFRRLHNSLGDHVNMTVEQLRKEYGKIRDEMKDSEMRCKERIKGVVSGFTEQKDEIIEDIKKLSETNAEFEPRLSKTEEMIMILQRDIKNQTGSAAATSHLECSEDAGDPNIHQTTGTSVESRAANIDDLAFLASWKIPVAATINGNSVDQPRSSLDLSKTNRDSPQTSEGGTEAKKKRKRDYRDQQDSSDVIFTGERTGSGSLKRKVARVTESLSK